MTHVWRAHTQTKLKLVSQKKKSLPKRIPEIKGPCKSREACMRRRSACQSSEHTLNGEGMLGHELNEDRVSEHELNLNKGVC